MDLEERARLVSIFHAMPPQRMVDMLANYSIETGVGFGRGEVFITCESHPQSEGPEQIELDPRRTRRAVSVPGLLLLLFNHETRFH